MKKNEEILRLKRVLLNDNISIPNGVMKILKNDISHVLQGYFNLTEDGAEISIDIDQNGIYQIKISANADGVKEVRII
ncbi:hypothetical protein EOM82_02340 [bacterium]|nr:hypothetical protein [bacterium]